MSVCVSFIDIRRITVAWIWPYHLLFTLWKCVTAQHMLHNPFGSQGLHGDRFQDSRAVAVWLVNWSQVGICCVGGHATGAFPSRGALPVCTLTLQQCSGIMLRE